MLSTIALPHKYTLTLTVWQQIFFIEFDFPNLSKKLYQSESYLGNGAIESGERVIDYELEHGPGLGLPSCPPACLPVRGPEFKDKQMGTLEW